MIELLPLAASDSIRHRAQRSPLNTVLVDTPPRIEDDVTLADQMIASARGAGLDEPTDLGDWAIDALDAEALLDRVPRPMSRGERQTCALLIALARPFEVLCLIDPTAGLDPRRRRVVAQLLTDLAHDHTVVCASDDPALQR